MPVIDRNQFQKWYQHLISHLKQNKCQFLFHLTTQLNLKCPLLLDYPLQLCEVSMFCFGHLHLNYQNQSLLIGQLEYNIFCLKYDFLCCFHSNPNQLHYLIHHLLLKWFFHRFWMLWTYNNMFHPYLLYMVFHSYVVLMVLKQHHHLNPNHHNHHYRTKANPHLYLQHMNHKLCCLQKIIRRSLLLVLRLVQQVRFYWRYQMKLWLHYFLNFL